ncbi:MAG: ABC transporter permease [Acidimicrobiales bacterium]
MTALDHRVQAGPDPLAGGRAELPLRVITGSPPLRQQVRDIWSYRELLAAQTRKELKVRYKGSALGFFWSMLTPASTLGVYYVVFQILLKNGTPHFALFLASGILCFNMLTMALTVSVSAVVSHSAIVKKVSFPREILAIAPTGAATVHLGLQAVVVAAFLAAFRSGPAVAYLPLLVPAVVALTVFSAAVGLLLAAVNVRVRDMEHALQIALQVWFWATPILITYRRVRDSVLAGHSVLGHVLFVLYRLDPMTPIVLTFQRVIYAKTSPQGVPVLPDQAGQWWYLWQLLAVIGFSCALFVVALKVFNRCQGSFAEEL